MSFDAGAVVGRLEMNIQGWKQAVDTVKKDQTSLSGLVMRHEQQIKSLGKTFTVAGAAMVASLGAMVKKTADYGDGLNDLRQRTGIAVTTLSSFKLAADKCGTSIEGFATGMKGLSRVMFEAATGGAEAKDVFKAVGVSATDSAGKVRPLDQVMLDVADRFAGMADGAAKNALAMKLFGKAGMDLIPMLNMGRAGLEAEMEAAKRLGLVMSDETAKACDEFNDALTELKGGLQGVGIQIGTALMPVMKGAVTGLTNLVVMIKDAAAAHPELIQAVGALGFALGGQAMILGPLIMMLPKLVAGLTLVSTAMNLSATGMVVVGGLYTALIGGIVLYISKLFELAAAEAYAQKATQRLWETENNLVDKLSAAASAADWQYGRMSKLIQAYDFNYIALIRDIQAGKLGKDIQDGLAEASKKHAAEVEKLRTKTEGLTVATQSLNEKLGLTLRIDMEKKYKDMLTALTAYKGQLSVAAEKKMMDDLIALRAELDNTKPSIVSVDDVLKGVDETIANLFTEGELADWGDTWTRFTQQLQQDFETAAEGEIRAILTVGGSAEALEGKLKLIGDAMGVSAETVRVACWNIQAEFLRTMGIIVPMIERLPTVTAGAVKTMGDYFNGLFNDIATGLGNALSDFFTFDWTASEKQGIQNLRDQLWQLNQDFAAGTITQEEYAKKYKEINDQMAEYTTGFGELVKKVWGNIKDAFFRMIGEMIAGWTINFVKKLITDAIDVGKSIAKSIGGALGGVGQAAGSMAGSFLTAASSIANIVTAVASVVALLKSPPTGAGDGMGRVVERQDIQTALLTSMKDFLLNDQRLGIQWTGKCMDYLWEVKGDLHTAMGYLKTIADKISNLAGAAAGAVSTQTQLMVVHGTPRDPEYIGRASQLAGIAQVPQAAGRGQGPVNLTIPFYLDGKLLDERMLRIANGRVEWLHGEYRRSNRLIPARTIGGAG